MEWMTDVLVNIDNMASNSSGKQYGLLLPKKDRIDAIQRPAVFDEDSDSGGSATGEGDWLKKTYQKEANKSVEKRQTKVQMQQALSQDPTIYQYDEVYEDIKDKITKPEVKKEEKKTSRYIQSLKKNAEKRKLENERRQERLVQKERIAEGEQFKDKETFVTSAYRKKLEEFNKMDEEERRIDYLEEIGDVAKQKDLSGFYRHLYKTTVDKDESKKTEPPEPKSVNKHDEKAKQSSHKSKRHYRKHNRSESSLEEGEAGDSDSASSSTSSSSSSSNSDSAGDKGKKRPTEDTSKFKKSDDVPNSDSKKRIKSNDNDENSAEIVEKSKHESKEKDTKADIKNESSEQAVELPELKVNIWAKRTVGDVFDDALKKFLERSATRQGVF